MTITTGKSQAARRWVDALMAVVERTGRIVTGISRLSYGITKLYGAPAASDNRHVWFDETEVIQPFLNAWGTPKASDEFISTIRGLSYHEMCHVMFTPASRSDIGKWVMENGFMNAFNLLEDQRIEVMFSARFSSTSHYFKLLVSKFLVNAGPDSDTLYLLVGGRLYLPRKFRRLARSEFVKTYSDSLANEVDDIVKQYLPLALPADSLKAQPLISRMDRVIQQVTPIDSGGTTTCGHPVLEDGTGKGKPTSGSAGVSVQREIGEEIKDMLEKDDSQDDSDDSGSDGPDSDDSDGDSPNDADGDISEEGGDTDNNRDGGEAGPDGPTEPHDSGGVATSGNTKEGTSQQKAEISDLWDELQDMLEEAINSQEIQDDVEEIQRAVRSQVGQQTQLVRSTWDHSKQQVTTEMTMASNRVYTEIQRLRLGTEPTWLRGEVSGRVNINRAMLAKPHELNIFDRWDEGSEELGAMEFAIAVDGSGSMGGHPMLAASQMLWVLRSTLSRLDIPVTVGIFASEHSVIPSRDRPEATRFDSYEVAGATVPDDLLVELNDLLTSSPATNRICLIITDGEWTGKYYQDGTPLPEETIRQMRSHGIVVGLVGLRNAVARFGSHGAEFGVDVNSPSEIVGMVAHMAESVLRMAQVNHSY